MFPDIEEIRKERKRYNGKLFLSGVETFRKMGEVEERALQSGALDRKTKELIALGISMANSCYG
ncbi:MAG: carboxymuconolactone decarboxylase family protein [Pseudomonadota bacterium]